jgi:uncharacterized phage infection (PIP) family protein YhgE
VQDAALAVQNVKKELLAQTKQFRATFPESVPTDAGAALLSQYQDQLTKVRGFVKTYEAAIAKVFASLAPMDDPVGLFRSIISKLRTLPTFEIQLADLRSRAESARRGAEVVAALRDSLAQLRHECEDQVSIAGAAHSAAASDIDVSDFEEQKAAAEAELKAAEGDLLVLTRKKEQAIEQFRERQIEIDYASAVQAEQLEAFRNELREVELSVQESERLQEGMLASGLVAETEQKILEITSELSQITDQISELEHQIETRKGRNEVQRQLLLKRVESVNTTLSSIERALQELPSPFEWEKTQAELNVLRSAIELEDRQTSLKQELTKLSQDRAVLASSREAAQEELTLITAAVDRKKREIERLIDGADEDSEIVSVLKSQKKMLSVSLAGLNQEAHNLVQVNAERRREKDAWEGDVGQMKRQMKGMPSLRDPENPVVRLARPERRRKADDAGGVTRLCITNRTFRLAVIGYIVFLHIIIYLMSFGRFMK